MRGATAARLLVGLVALVAALALAEAALRVAGIDYTPMRIEDRHDYRTEHLFDTSSFVYDPVLLWRPRAGRGVFNRQGFRGAEVGPEKPAGALRLAAVGDSNTLGWEGAAGVHWPGDLERLLRRDDDRHRVVNAGVWGYSSHQGVPRLRQVLALRPDLVLISFGSNDAEPVAVPDRAFAGAARPPAWKRRLGGLRLGRLLLGSLAAAGAGRAAGEPAPRVGLEEYRDNLRRMIDLARRAGTRPVLLTRPYQDSVPQTPRWKGLAPRYNAATAEVAAETGVGLVDLYTLFKTRDDLFADESHFTADGHQLAAEMLYERLRPVLRQVLDSRPLGAPAASPEIPTNQP